MRRKTTFAWLIAFLMLTAGPVAAQSRDRDTGGGWWPWAGDQWERNHDDDDRARDNRDDDRDEARRGNGPPFCRNGQGHPKHGRKWCEEKGWGRDRDRSDDRDKRGRNRRDDEWGEVGWEDVILRRPAWTNRTLGEQSLRDILGATVLGRLSTHASRLGARGALDGRMVNVANGSVLQLRAGGTPIAELTDRNRDGRFDLVLLRRI